MKFSIDDLDKVISGLPKKPIYTFKGPLGAGKTTFIKEYLKSSGVLDEVTSPTFNYVNRYENEQGEVFYHFDLYRLDSVDDFLDMGFDEFLVQGGATSLIEWPDAISSLLENLNVCAIELDYQLDDMNLREIKIFD